MSTNSKKTCCLRIGPRCTVNCCNISTAEGRAISYASELRYLGVFVVRSRTFKCAYDNAKRSFYSAVNGILGKVLNFAPEDVILQLIVSKCMPILLYGLDACHVNKTDLRSLDFTVDRVFMKLLKTGNIEIVRECQAFFGFKLPSVLLNISSDKFIRLYDASDNVVCTSLRVN